MHAAPMDDFERLEREFMELREAVVDFFTTYMLVDDDAVRVDAARVALEALKPKPFRPDFELQWEVGSDVEIRFEPEEDEAA